MGARSGLSVEVQEDEQRAVRAAAERIASVIRARDAAGEAAVLGLATGATMVGVYGELVRMHRQEGLSFAKVVSFNLDEYWPMGPQHPQSYRRFMQEMLFDHVDIVPENTHLPDGTLAEDALEQHCHDYERFIRQAGEIDHFIVGIGRTGHIGFNEPGSGAGSRTRLVTLDHRTREDNARLADPGTDVPAKALSMGVGTILEARAITLLALGGHKAPIVARALEGSVNEEVAASYLQVHGNTHVILDRAAASALSDSTGPEAP